MSSIGWLNTETIQETPGYEEEMGCPEISVQPKMSGAEFAADQQKKLTQDGFSLFVAGEIIKYAGPTVAIKAADWAKSTVKKIGADATLTLLNALIRETESEMFRGRVLNLLNRLDLPTPDIKATVIGRFLKGALKAIQCGLPRDLLF